MDKLFSYIEQELSYTPYQIQIIRYVLTCLWMELSKFFILFLLFLFLGKLPQYFLILFLLLPLRFFSGGLHMHSYLSCLCMTLTMFLLSAYLPDFFIIPGQVRIFLQLLCLILYFLIGPVASALRPKPGIDQIKRCRLITLFFHILFLLISFFFAKDYYPSLICVTILLQTMQLIIAKIFLTKGGTACHETKINETA